MSLPRRGEGPLKKAAPFTRRRRWEGECGKNSSNRPAEFHLSALSAEGQPDDSAATATTGRLGNLECGLSG